VSGPAGLALTGFGRSAPVSGGGGYTAKAVHFDGSTFLQNLTLACTNSTSLLTNVWVRAASWAGAPALWSSDPNNNGLALEINNSGNDHMEQYLLDGMGSLFYASDAAALDLNTWINYLIATDTNHDEGSKVCVIYRTNTLATPGAGTDTGPAFSSPFSGKEFDVGSDTIGDPFTGDMADFSFWPNTSVIVGGDIPLATRRLFIDASNKPVDPATAIATLGTPPILFSGDHTTFPTNQGSGGAFSLTGSLTDASTHP